LRNDKEIVTIAIKNDGYSLKFASKELHWVNWRKNSMKTTKVDKDLMKDFKKEGTSKKDV
jgi:hypothetical protein